MMAPHNCLGLTLIVTCLTTAAIAQPPENGGFGRPGGPRGFGPGGPREDRKLVEQFDLDENGWLNREERVAARVAAKSDQDGRQGGFGPPGGPRFGRGQREPAKPGRPVSPDSVENYPDADLYDSTVFRTLFVEFDNEDWEQELEDFHGTDVDVPATLTVDGVRFENVGIRFRGMSSYGMVPTGYKRSLNVSIDLADESQRLYGYKTLNLLNSAGDPSFMSTVLYSHIASQYIPVPKANHVRVVINGESWGVYVNVQQFNKDFLAEHFESTKGTRWKASGSPMADAGLRYFGEDIEEYKRHYEMKSNDGKKAWNALVQLCRVLDETPLDKLESELEPLLDIDATLRFLALDVALVNSDGYWTRASDYSLFLDRDGRFHLFPHDMNEAFHSGHRPRGFGGPPRGPGGFAGPDGRVSLPGDFGPNGFGPGRVNAQARSNGGQNQFSRRDGRPPRPNFEVQPEGRRGPGGPGGFGGPGGPGHGGPDLDPFVGIDNPRMPLRSRLLAVPQLREKYLMYVREIAETSLDWHQIGPVIAQQTKLIKPEVAVDTRKLDTLEAFNVATSLRQSSDEESQSLRSFFDQRREYLLGYRESIEVEK